MEKHIDDSRTNILLLNDTLKRLNQNDQAWAIDTVNRFCKQDYYINGFGLNDKQYGPCMYISPTPSWGDGDRINVAITKGNIITDLGDTAFRLGMDCTDELTLDAFYAYMEENNLYNHVLRWQVEFDCNMALVRKLKESPGRYESHVIERYESHVIGEFIASIVAMHTALLLFKATASQNKKDG